MIPTNAILDVNNEYTIRCIQLLNVGRLPWCDWCEREQIVNNFQSYTFRNQKAALSHPSRVNVLVRVIAKKANDTLVDPS